uniref:Coiled-coil domain-containing protein 6 n=1 Tax=Mesocestoides corti TaxID=53468 RepID=A0A5K3FYP8_MESCO
MLEKEREKLQIELENERTQNKRLEKELKRALDNYNNQKALTQRQRMVAAQIIKEKRRISKEFLAKCEQVEQLESKLGLKSAVLPDISSAGKAVSPSTTAKVPTCLRSPVEADASSSVEPSSRNQRSMSPPPKCRGSKNSPPPPPSPVIPPSKLDSGGCTVSP